jgi:regulator of cell morphogenesis and NO signaling
METLVNQSLKNIALENHKAIPVLEKYSLDFCCKGGKTLEQACVEKNLVLNDVVEEINTILGNNNKNAAFNEMSAEQLISYILIHHHVYVKTNIPVIFNHIQKVATKHGERFPYVQEVLGLFQEVAAELIDHMEKEEKILFPRIKAMFSEEGKRQNIDVAAPIHVMELEHEKAGDLLFKIREITHFYSAPETACTTHRIMLDELRAFEEDLHQHVHLENNILFPMAMN